MPDTIRYVPPTSTRRTSSQAPAARTVAADRDGVLPDGFFATTNLPTYVKGADGAWTMPREPRMDGVLVRDAEGTWWVREGRRVKSGDEVVVGRAEDGSEGVLVHARGFAGEAGAHGDFHFMSSQVSREKPIDYRQIARMLVEEKRRGGYVLWVTGPALVHSRARDNLVWFIRNGYVQALLAGNAVAVHDIEAEHRRHDAGDDERGRPDGGRARGPHAGDQRRPPRRVDRGRGRRRDHHGRHHARLRRGGGALRPRPARSATTVRSRACSPTTSRRRTRRAQHTIKATMAVMIATALHSIAVGNMLPAYYEDATGELRELPTICVDASEFLVSKLKDRGTHQAVGVVTNAQDFMSILQTAVEREVENW